MFRRNFIQKLTWTGASGLVITRTANAGKQAKITCRIQGFTCPACAVGLQTMLCEKKGVLRAEANYSAAAVTIEYDPTLINDQTLRSFVSEMGFHVSEVTAGKQKERPTS